MGELAQLSGRPYLVDAIALTDVEAIAIPPERLRALLIAEADLGERIMRALILRRVGLIEAGAGPIIVGPEGNARRSSAGQFPAPQWPSLPAARSRQRHVRGDPDRPLPGRSRGTADRPLSERRVAAQPERRPDRALRRAGQPDQSRQALRCRDHRRRSRRPCHRRLCRQRRPVGAGDRLPLVRRPGRRLGADRKLPRLPDRHFGNGADGPGLQPGAEVRGRDG